MRKSTLFISAVLTTFMLALLALGACRHQEPANQEGSPLAPLPHLVTADIQAGIEKLPLKRASWPCDMTSAPLPVIAPAPNVT